MIPPHILGGAVQLARAAGGNESRLKNERDMSHEWMHHVTHIGGTEQPVCVEGSYAPAVRDLRDMSHPHIIGGAVRLACVPGMNESCHMHECVMSHPWEVRLAFLAGVCMIEYVTHIDESCHTYEWLMSHEWMRHVAYIGGVVRLACVAGTYAPALSDACSPCPQVRVTWLIHMCDITHSHVWHHSFICVTWLIHMCDMTHSYVWHVPFICVTWLMHACDMTHSYVWHDSFMCVTWLIHMCNTTHPYVWHSYVYTSCYKDIYIHMLFKIRTRTLPMGFTISTK